MTKISVAIIFDNDKILMARRAIGEKFAGIWELPGGKVKDGERASAGLKRELKEKLNINAEIGKLAKSVRLNGNEVFAYTIQNFDGTINLSRYDETAWVSLDRVMSYSILPADRQIIMDIAKIKPEKSKEKINVIDFMTRKVKRPVFDTAENCWVVVSTEIEDKPTKTKFMNKHDAIDFYIGKVRNLLTPFFAQTINNRQKS